MAERQAVNTGAILTEAERRLRSLSPERLRLMRSISGSLTATRRDQRPIDTPDLSCGAGLRC